MWDWTGSMDAHERVARAAIVEAATILRSAWQTAKTVERKGVVDLVTDTDLAVEAAIVARLSAAFPEHVVVAEEAHADRPPVRPDPTRFAWYVDPIDGTTNFAHAYPHFAVSLALYRGDEAIFGIVHDPIRDETFHAVRGAGAFLNDRPIATSEVDRLEDALVATGFPYDRRDHLQFYMGFYADGVRLAQGVRRNGSAALDLCYVACGRLDAFFEWKLKPWDTAAGALLIREAGGTVTDFGGGAFDLYDEQTLASNGRLHGPMADMLTSRMLAHAPSR